EDIREIVRRSARILNVPIDDEAAGELARRSRGTPRVANRLLRRVRDFAEVRAAGHIDAAVATSALDLLEVDLEGFDLLDRRLLLTVIEKFAGGPVGIDSLSATLGEERGTLEDVVEPFLIQQGFLVRSARGRVATASAWRHFGREPPQAEAGAGSLPLFRG
ncbi:MAG: Holliday junction DNA helicase RuvB C-terminal domain-containing protein, partial [Burkholderiales bacterium]